MSNPRLKTYFEIDKHTQVSKVRALQPSDQIYIGIRAGVSLTVIAAIPQHIEVGVCEDVTQEIIKALPTHLDEITIIGNIKSEVVSSITQNITSIIIRDITDPATVRAIPRHIDYVMLHRSISAQSVAALPIHISKVGILKNFKPEAARAIPPHIKEANIHSGVSKETISAIPHHIQLLNPNNHPEIDALIQARLKRQVDAAPNSEPPAKRPRIEAPKDRVTQLTRLREPQDSMEQSEVAGTLVSMPQPSLSVASAPSVAPLPIPTPPTPVVHSPGITYHDPGTGTSITIPASLFLTKKTPAERVATLESSMPRMREQVTILQQENAELRKQLGMVEQPPLPSLLPFPAKALLVARITDLETTKAQLQRQIEALSRDNAEFKRQLGMQEEQPRMTL